MNNKQFVIVAAITFFVGMVWLVSDIIFNTKASIPISPKLQVLLEPVNPNFNPRVLEIIDKEVAQTSLPATAPAPITTPQIQTEPTEQSTESAEVQL